MQAEEGPNRGPEVRVRSGRPAQELTVEAPAVVLTPEQALKRRRRPWIGTLIAAGGVAVAGGVLGGVALAQAQRFHQEVAAGGVDRMGLQTLGDGARKEAFATDLLLGTAALLGLVTIVLRFGADTSTPPSPPDIEPAYQVP